MGLAKADADLEIYQAGLNFVESKTKSAGITLNGNIHFVNIGNLHVVIPVFNLDRKMLHTIGPALQKCELWDGINVHLIEQEELDDRDQVHIANELGSKAAVHYRALVWERGAGPTQACGSGVCAIAKSGILESDSQTGEWTAVSMPGGRLYAQVQDEEDPILLAGPQTFVYDGKILL
jgi:diaminopimelate epimerase